MQSEKPTLDDAIQKLIVPDDSATSRMYKNIQHEMCKHLLEHVEELYQITHDLLDKKFRKEIKQKDKTGYDKFNACYSEMYFAAVLRQRLGLTLTHPADKGPDLFIKEYDCWAEIIAATDGEEGNPNSIPAPQYGVAVTPPIRQKILRLTNAFTKKVDAVKKYLQDGIIKPNEKVIICISGGGMSEWIPDYAEGGCPEIAQALLSVGNLQLKISIDTGKIIDKGVEYRPTVPKITDSNPQPISTSYFWDPSFSFISGVLYSYVNAANPLELNKIGYDFSFVHNPLAKNKIPEGAIKCGEEFFAESNGAGIIITRINHNPSE